ncbi:hypothetical protein C8R46DRAFT_1359169 [Mycena filopes]|nr:hypothetical protein C8R46DRAFT_1359169 [Mycena filopes]
MPAQQRRASLPLYFTLEVPPPYEKPKTVRRSRESSISRPPRHLESPEKREAHRRSSLPTSAVPSAHDNPFLEGYKAPTLSRPSSRARSHSRRKHIQPDTSVTVVPLSFDQNDDDDEDTVHQGLLGPEQTPRAHRQTPSSTPASPTDDYAMTDATIVVFDADAFGKSTPTHQDENPHGNYPAYVAEGPNDLTAFADIQLIGDDCPALVMSFETATTNLAPKQVAHALHDPTRNLLLIPFLGGEAYYKNYTAAPDDLTKVLEPITGADGVVIFPPDAKEKLKAGSGDGKYLAPYPMLATCATPEIFAKLTRHKLIVKDRKLAVHVFPVTAGKLSWTMGQWKCRGSSKGTATLATQLKVAAGSAIFAGGPLRTSVVRMTQHETTKSADRRVYDFISTIDVRYKEHDTEPLWIVYARPCTEFEPLWEAFRTLMRDTTLGEGFATFTPVGSAPRHIPGRNGQPGPRPLALCFICKLDDHRTLTCPYRTLLDWQGPNDVIDNIIEVVSASGRSFPARGRGQLRSRGANRRNNN